MAYVTVANTLLDGDTDVVFADAGDWRLASRARNESNTIDWQVAMRPRKHRSPGELDIEQLRDLPERLREKLQTKGKVPSAL